MTKADSSLFKNVVLCSHICTPYLFNDPIDKNCHRLYGISCS